MSVCIIGLSLVRELVAAEVSRLGFGGQICPSYLPAALAMPAYCVFVVVVVVVVDLASRICQTQSSR